MLYNLGKALPFEKKNSGYNNLYSLVNNVIYNIFIETVILFLSLKV